ncbi:MAG TPA: molecular chaperone DnaJ [Patescibacteria group bacterium]|nr:molecular chaperone DnaJ [Patescibacteria group bacterium]
MPKDYYEILGISKNAGESDIKRAYRKLAHEYHPDKGGSSDKFKEINQAYEVLSDPKKRQQYDQFGTTFEGAPGGEGHQWSDFSQGQSPYGGFGGFEDLSDVFDQFFGGGFGGFQTQKTRQRAGGERGRDLEKKIAIDFTEAIFGSEKTIEFERQSRCDHCKGSGAEPGSKIIDCKTCQGRGEVAKEQRTFFGTFRTASVCTACGGRGKSPEKKCGTCKGSGAAWKKTALRVTIPPGIENDTVLKLSGEGEAGFFGGASGDLYLQIAVGKHPRLERRGNNIHSTIYIPYPTAVLGGTVRVETVWGEVELKIPSGTPSHHQFILRSKGAPQIHSRHKGDHIVTAAVSVPAKLSREQRKVLEELQTIESK